MEAERKNVSYADIDAPQGHDAFLLPIPRYMELAARLLRPHCQPHSWPVAAMSLDLRSWHRTWSGSPPARGCSTSAAAMATLLARADATRRGCMATVIENIDARQDQRTASHARRQCHRA
jgi:hypothetical protein